MTLSGIPPLDAMNDSDNLLGAVAPLQGGTPFTSERSMRAFRLNKCLASLLNPRNRELFKLDPEAYMLSWHLSDMERNWLHRRDFPALLDHGACLLTLGTVMRVFGLTLVEVGASGRGQTVAEFVAQKRVEAKGTPWQF